MQSGKFKVAIIICAIAFTAILVMFSPIFYLNEIIITGENAVTHAEIRERLGADSTTNLLFFNTNAARYRIMENLYISEVNFTRNMARRHLYVNVRERRLAAYVEHSPGRYLYIDSEGRVLEVREFTTLPLPIVEGLNFTLFELGEKLEVPDSTAFNIVTLYAQLIYRHGLHDRVSYINVSDTSNTRILVGYIEFNVGGTRDADLKVRTIAGILEAMPEAELARGFVDLTEIKPEYIFEILT